MSTFVWRPPERADDAAWVGLLAAIEAHDQRGETYEIDDLDDEWASVWSHPDTDATFVWDGEDLVAFVWIKAMPGERTAHRVACWGGVRPSHRRRGIGTALFGWMLDRTPEISARFDPSLPVSVQVDATEHQSDVVALAQRAGFEPTRHFVDVARPMARPVEVPPAPPGLELVSWSDALDEPARLAHVEAFAGHWGSEPRSQEEWSQWYTGHRSFRPDLSVLAVDPESGQVVSLVLCATYPQDWGPDVPVEAWITTVGTRPGWRSRGAGRWLLGEALRRIAQADDGFERAILSVDEENVTGALRLYRALGFSDDTRRVTFLERGPMA